MIMDGDEARVLEILLRHDKPLTTSTVRIAMGMHGRHSPYVCRAVMRRILLARAVTKHGRNPLRYAITERGRIAVALHRAIQNRKEAA